MFCYLLGTDVKTCLKHTPCDEMFCVNFILQATNVQRPGNEAICNTHTHIHTHTYTHTHTHTHTSTHTYTHTHAHTQMQLPVKGRSYSMRHPTTRRYGDRDYNYHPKSSATGRNPDIVINGRGNESSDSLGSGHQGTPHGLEDLGMGKLGIASNPNRAEMPHHQNKRKGSYDTTVSCTTQINAHPRSYMHCM